MANDSQLLFTEEQLAKNPAVDLQTVNEAERARKQLESLGVWKESGSRVRNPYEIKPDMRAHGQKINQLMAQS